MSWPPHGSQGAPLPPSPFAPADDVQAQQYQSAVLSHQLQSTALSQRLQRNADNVRAHMVLPGTAAPPIATPVQEAQRQAATQAVHPRVAELTELKIEKQMPSSVPNTSATKRIVRTSGPIHNSHASRSPEQIAEVEKMKRHTEAQKARTAANDRAMMPPPSQINARTTTQAIQSVMQASGGTVRGHTLQPAGGAAVHRNAEHHGRNLPLTNVAPLTGDVGRERLIPTLPSGVQVHSSLASSRNVHVQGGAGRVELRKSPTSDPSRRLNVPANQSTTQGNGPRDLAGSAPSGIARQHEQTGWRPHASTPAAAQAVPASSAIDPQSSGLTQNDPGQAATRPVLSTVHSPVAVPAQSQIHTRVQPAEPVKPSTRSHLKYPKMGLSLLSATRSRSMRQHHSTRAFATNAQPSEQDSNLLVSLPDYGSPHDSQFTDVSQTDPTVDTRPITREASVAQGRQELRVDLSSAFDVEQAFRRIERKKELKKNVNSRFHDMLIHLCKVDKSLRQREFRRFLSSLGFTSSDLQREALNVLRVMLRDHRARDTRSEYTTVKRWMGGMMGYSTKEAKKARIMSEKAVEAPANDGAKKLSLFCSGGVHKLKCGHDRISNEACGMDCYGSKYQPDVDMRELGCPKCVW
ncbi:hypothetical protein AUEXF2481DRAFT_3311 [Aureobasidium subglaciale EXF-2481]|uniref:Uncharacterized protein n=1 Tax=Aureobasidium subglaciale (strain EXF-2481) TaxID=1043005 RepID=A0A074ZFW5_AURSE|nr:uncharacterized protein AUEXF2481DRAFT_3311 [Aureobasidium subglaciale EXF-2481]KAI5195006.1 hypothetical protein E4T38_09299 [Aureobasidium subglaciale]KAI5214100.1 hypothetical protein E4T40_09250 [Aureobasidium subglaciale]KAI5216469.1 hypothetical protein E4T41_09251 [Aureobasidium subglaciale]KAI5254406.1 hypothetical protein E4T46_09206 [Aureobasidium subglaciale]KEQ97506.1 hypothetical protein AUEXF2481DRAFT_3311 [Aureobasidium subglaciale EXF-2481]